MANKLTPEEAIEVIKKGLEKCRSLAEAVLRHEPEYDGTVSSARGGRYRWFSAVPIDLMTKVSTASKAFDNLAGSNLTPFFWRAFVGYLQEVDESADSAISKAKSQLSEHKLQHSEALRSDNLRSGNPLITKIMEEDALDLIGYFEKIIPLFQNIKEEIKILQAICKQFAK